MEWECSDEYETLDADRIRLTTSIAAPHDA
jgi:hypothetical protein